jgi:lysylphosphatidylglycerol synthetase-like protein (DUF2156 family)
MKSKILFLLLLLIIPQLVFAQNVTNQTTNQTTQTAGISLPFIGEITLIGGIVGIVLFIIGYFIGSALKSGIKYAFIFLLFIIVLYVLGFLSKEIITRIGEGIGVLKSFYSGFQSNFGMGSGALNLQIVLFVLGLIVGLWKG